MSDQQGLNKTNEIELTLHDIALLRMLPWEVVFSGAIMGLTLSGFVMLRRLLRNNEN